MSTNEKGSYTPGEIFHAEKQPVYAGTHGFAVNKKAEHMAKVVYEAPHFNPRETGLRRGAGRDFATWIFSEEGEQAERLFSTPLELMMDARLEPLAAIGLHSHEHTEEVYYVLEGQLRMTTVDSQHGEHTVVLGPGDAHLVKLGQAHHGQALEAGARFIVVAVRRGSQAMHSGHG
jgi:mannose-6-phosphate isomerase-like protein (cupin superfamily)